MEQKDLKRKLEITPVEEDCLTSPPPAKKSTRTQCKFCDKAFNKVHSLHIHINKDHNDQLDATWIKCNECKCSFPNDDSLSDHMVIRHSRSNTSRISFYSKSENDSSFETSEQQGNDPSVATKRVKERESTRVKCHFCPSAFNKEERLQKHLKSVHKDICQKEMLSCLPCGFFLPDQDTLKSHVLTKHPDCDTFFLKSESNQGGAEEFDGETMPHQETEEAGLVDFNKSQTSLQFFEGADDNSQMSQSLTEADDHKSQISQQDTIDDTSLTSPRFIEDAKDVSETSEPSIETDDDTCQTNQDKMVDASLTNTHSVEAVDATSEPSLQYSGNLDVTQSETYPVTTAQDAENDASQVPNIHDSPELKPTSRSRRNTGRFSENDPQVKTSQSILCQVCNKSQKSGNKYAIHVNQMHSDFAQTQWISCSHCSLYLPDDDSLAKHKQKHNQDVARTNCTFCEKTYSRRADFVVHVNKVHRDEAVENNWINCEHCDCILPNDLTLRRHISTAHKRKPILAAESYKDDSHSDDVSSFLEVSMTDDQADAEIKVEPELEAANEGELQESEMDFGSSYEQNDFNHDLPIVEDNNGNDDINYTGNEDVCQTKYENGHIPMEDDNVEEPIEEISLIDTDDEDNYSTSSSPHIKLISHSTPNFPPKMKKGERFLPLKDVYVHNGVYASRNYIEMEDKIIMKMNYTKESKDIYFPENGPYRCEICHFVVPTNKSFFEHVLKKHFAEADEATVKIMEDHLTAANC